MTRFELTVVGLAGRDSETGRRYVGIEAEFIPRLDPLSASSVLLRLSAPGRTCRSIFVNDTALRLGVEFISRETAKTRLRTFFFAALLRPVGVPLGLGVGRTTGAGEAK